MALDTADKLLAAMDLGTPWRSPRYAPTASPDILHRFRLLGYFGYYDPSPFLRTGTGLPFTQVNDHGATSPGPFSWSGSTLGETGYNAVSGSANNGADTYALKFDTGEILPSSGVITGIEIKVTAYSPAATLDLQTLAYGPYAAVYKNGTYQSSTGAGQYLTSTPTEYTIGGSANTLGVTWSAGDTIDIALWVNLYDNVGTTPNCYITAATMQIWYSDGGTTQTITVTVASATASASAPTVTPGAATVTMPTASSTAAAIVPTVTPGATTVTVTTCSATASASSPTITPTVTIASATASATAAAISPTITAGTSTITVSTAQATASSSAPTITPTVTIVSPTASATASASAPTVTAGATTITVTTGTATAAAIDAGITNATLITPGDATATAAVSALLVIFGSTSIVVGTATGTAAVSSPTIAAGTTTISVGVVSATAGAVVVAVVSGNTAGTSTASVFYVLHGTDTHPIPLLGADPRPHEAAGTSNRFRELKG